MTKHLCSYCDGFELSNHPDSGGVGGRNKKFSAIKISIRDEISMSQDERNLCIFCKSKVDNLWQLKPELIIEICDLILGKPHDQPTTRS